MHSPLAVVVSAFIQRVMEGNFALDDVILGRDVVQLLSHSAFDDVVRPVVCA
jgi:hypothetical protein